MKSSINKNIVDVHTRYVILMNGVKQMEYQRFKLGVIRQDSEKDTSQILLSMLLKNLKK